MKPIRVEVEGPVEADLETSFRVFANAPLPRILTGYGPLPAVEAVVDQQGEWSRTGQTRQLLLADGSRMREELVSVDAPNGFRYVVDGFTGPVRHLVREMRGEWSFEPDPKAGRLITRARWRYDFHCTSRLAVPPSRAIIGLFWKPTMQRALAAASLQAAAAHSQGQEEPSC